MALGEDFQLPPINLDKKMSLRWADEMEDNGSLWEGLGTLREEDDGNDDLSLSQSSEEDGAPSPVYLKRWGVPIKTGFEELEPLVSREMEPMFSARLGSGYYLERASSSESIATDLSLLSCSSLGVKKVERTRRKQSKNQIRDTENTNIKTNWDQISANENSSLTQMVLKDASAMQGVGGGASFSLLNMTRAIEALNEAERKLILKTYHTRGIMGVVKSYSTTDVRESGTYTPVKLRQQKTLEQKATRTQSASSDRRPSRVSIRECPSSAGSHLPGIGQASTRGGSGASRTSADQRLVSAKKVFRNFSRMSSKMRRKILNTLADLDHNTGYGDTHHASMETMKDPSAFLRIEDDFQKLPRMPQRIRIAPQLAKVIKDDIRDRIGKPRYTEIKETLLQRFNKNLDQNERTQRNLMIFNWLQNLDEKNFEPMEPERNPELRMQMYGVTTTVQ
ncbi:uncharacterized protein LOC106151131 isoform X1 [Lingula anatina]|uniref:Uncharacterized protein LOC106151131 isoform X1 n=2 Tax=Lingula anatina TaxID=7574 RepID=A0A1S3H3H1_LINAN|nr:uncharacterized protein LOC106151131 isoform X1 [Lingula anatina]|eukprot:XP_013379684.1 uncharacterized protein LOC106151131 isoform X1 [Lingula anatina]